MRKDFAAKSFLFVAAAVYSQLLCGLLGKYRLVSELLQKMLTRLVKYFSTTVFSDWILDGRALRGSLFTQFLSVTISWRHISQGRVAACLRCGGIFNYYFIANSSHSLTMKAFWKSVKIWQSYWDKFTATFLCSTVYKLHELQLLLTAIIKPLLTVSIASLLQ